ncbi:MAG: nuclear transport factor 2 family protein [Micropepsaceae bacterium]
MTLRLLSVLIVLVSSLSAGAARAGEENAALTAEILALDGKVFDAYNRCDLKVFGNFFSPSVEFYHDTGGATFDRKTVLANTQKYICHKVRRELIASSLRVYPIKDFGAIEEGEHRFCQTESGACEGIAKFLIIWRKRASGWQITRVVSYGHRALAEGEN